MEKLVDDEVLTEEKIISMTGKELSAEVTKINCFAMGIKSICSLKSFTSLEIVSLSLNSLSSLAEFEQCVALKELYIRKNSISDLSEIRFLKKLPLLSVLFLADNPCCETTNYRVKVIRTLENLRKLDTDIIHTSERHDASVSVDKDVLSFDRLISNVLGNPSEIPSVRAQAKNETDISNQLKAVQLLMRDMSLTEIQLLSRWCDKRLLSDAGEK